MARRGRPPKLKIISEDEPKKNKSKILAKRLSFVVSQTAIDLNMTCGEISKAILMLMDENNDGKSD